MGITENENTETNQRVELVIVSNAKNFILNSIMETMRANNVSMKNIEIKEDMVNDFDLSGNYILIKADDFLDINYGILAKIRKHCREEKKGLVIIGYSEQIEQVKKVLDADDIIALEMVRQTDLAVLKTRLLKLIFNDKEEAPKKTILAVDDSGLMLRSIKMWLDNDYDLHLANSATKALGALNNIKPDLILLDYEMPVCSGAQLYQMLQGDENTKDIPVIFLTSKDDRETVLEVVGLKPAGYLLKTSTKEQIISKIEQVIDITSKKEQ